ncbi:hypothetical protein ABZ697_15895 [Streptomyces albidoflavus]|uniref:hypothetical protein n=1 Tax=Streptomyces albidoflavus TaxID=1886 RepID=UPI0033E293D0
MAQRQARTGDFGLEGVRVALDRRVHVEFCQLSVESDPETIGVDRDDAFAGQQAGLCGPAVPGALWLATGLHTGYVGFRVEVHDEEPPLDPGWDEAVEVPFHPRSPSTVLAEAGGVTYWQLGLPETGYRVRYCARGMDEGHDRDTLLEGEPSVDHYLLQFWPAPPAPGRVVRQSTGRQAAYWQAYVRGLPPPLTPEERAEAERLAPEVHARAVQQARLARAAGPEGPDLSAAALRAVIHVRPAP